MKEPTKRAETDIEHGRAKGSLIIVKLQKKFMAKILGDSDPTKKLFQELDRDSQTELYRPRNRCLLDGMADAEIITEKMFMDGYKSGFYDFDNFWVQIEEEFSRAGGPAFNYTFAYRKPPDYVPSGKRVLQVLVLEQKMEDK